MAGARFRLQLAVEFPHGQAPTVALINGHRVPLALTEPLSASPDVPDIASASLDVPALGFEAPSLFLAVRTAHQATNTALYTVPEDDSAVEGWASAAAFVTPFLQGWLGQSPRTQLTILDLPDPDDAPFETGPLLVTAIREATPDQLDGVFAHALTHAFLSTSTSSPPAWLSEGIAQFMGSLWLEKQQGRQKALESLESGRAALALAEPASPGESSGQPLAKAISPVYYRTKATYVFWMLRDLAGDAALSAALRAYNPAAEATAADAAHGATTASGSDYFEKLIEKADLHRDLSWFFSDWIDADKGLPDIAIDSVFPSHTEGDNWLVAVNLSNSGYAAAEIPVTLSNAATSITQRIVVPARGKATLRILLQGQPTQVQANDGTVPETEASVHVRNLDAVDNSGSPLSPPAAVQQ
jgi:Protein DA1